MLQSIAAMGVLVLKKILMVKHTVTVLLNGLGKNAKNAILVFLDDLGGIDRA